MKKFLLFLLVVSMPLLASSGKKAENNKLEFSEVLKHLNAGETQRLVVEKDGIYHRLGVVHDKDGKKAVVDTLMYVDLDIEGNPWSDYWSGFGVQYTGNDTATAYMMPLAPGQLLQIGASYHTVGTGTWNVYPPQIPYPDDLAPFPATDQPMLFFPVPWTITVANSDADGATGVWQWLDLEAQFLDIPVDDDFMLVHSRDGNGGPVVWMDGGGHPIDPPTGTPLNRTYMANDDAWYFIWNDVARTGVHYAAAAIVRYDEVPPVIENMTALSDFVPSTPTTSVSATISDLDGTISAALLKYKVNDGNVVDVAMSNVADVYSAALPLTGSVVGDSITYWVYAEDNDALDAESVKSGFRIVEGPSSEMILLLADNDGARTTIYTDALDMIVAEDPSKEYYVWDTGVRGGLDETILNHDFRHIIHEGFGATYTPEPLGDYTDPVGQAIVAGANYMLVDQDYFFRHDNDFSFGEFESGQFAFDILGLDSAVSDPSAFGTGTMFMRMVEGTDFAAHVGVDELALDYGFIGLSNWTDYIAANQITSFNVCYDTTAMENGFFEAVINRPANDHGVLFFATQIEAAGVENLKVVLDYFFDKVTTVEEGDGLTVARNFQLGDNYPNPFNPSTTIEFYAPKQQKVVITVFNTIGKRIKTLYNGLAPVGKNEVVWNGTDISGNAVASGVYYYQAKVAGKVYSNKMILIK